MATELETQLAEALRRLLTDEDYPEAERAARQTLARFDAQQSAPSEPAECGNTPYDEGPFTLAAPSEQPAQGEREAFEAALAGMSAGTYVIPGWDVHRVRTALAQQPAAGVALTDEQLDAVYSRCVPAGTQPDKARQHARAVIAEFCRVKGITAPKGEINGY